MCNWLTKEELLGKLPAIRSLLVFFPISSSAPPTLLTIPQMVVSVWVHRGVCRGRHAFLCPDPHQACQILPIPTALLRGPQRRNSSSFHVGSSIRRWTLNRIKMWDKSCHLGKVKKWPQDYINYTSLYHNTVQRVLYYLNVSHNLTSVHIPLISI